MACNEIVQMRREVCASLGYRVGQWQHDLQTRYGDPRVYAMQQAAMHQQEAALAHDLSRRKSAAQSKSYDDKSVSFKETHDARIKSTLSKRRGRKGSGKPPESAPDPPPTPPP
jgi:hypothetical protein